MALQGFVAKTTVFNSDGSITETNGNGQTLTTTFNSDGSITERFVGEKTITKTITFKADGSIGEVIS
jgi:diaminopimelate epimerase